MEEAGKRFGLRIVGLYLPFGLLLLRYQFN